jgi:hypothetical protein
MGSLLESVQCLSRTTQRTKMRLRRKDALVAMCSVNTTNHEKMISPKVTSLRARRTRKKRRPNFFRLIASRNKLKQGQRSTCSTSICSGSRSTLLIPSQRRSLSSKNSKKSPCKSTLRCALKRPSRLLHTARERLVLLTRS